LRTILCFIIVATIFVETSYCSICLSVPREGDWAVYSVDTWYTTNATEEDVEWLIEDFRNINDTKWTLRVEEFHFPQIKFSIEKAFSDETTLTENHEGSIITGYKELGMWIIQSSLNDDDAIYEGDESANIPIISSSTEYPFANTTRDVVYASFTKHEPVGEYYIPIYIGAFWDRETGILCGMISTATFEEVPFLPDVYLYIKTDIEIVETTLWTESKSEPADFTWLIASTIVILLLISVAAVFILNQKKVKKRKTRKRTRKSVKAFPRAPIQTWDNLYMNRF